MVFVYSSKHFNLNGLYITLAMDKHVSKIYQSTYFFYLQEL